LDESFATVPAQGLVALAVQKASVYDDASPGRAERLRSGVRSGVL
jgi:hypothetical protein